MLDFRAYADANAVPLDDPDALAGLFENAQIVAVGESAHRIPAYYELRRRVTAFLAGRHGFTVFGMESGFSEGLALDAWLRGGPGAVDERHFTYRMGDVPAMREQLRWMRDTGMRYLGLDVPGSAADPRPALESVRRLLGEEPGVTELLALVDRWASEHQLPAQAAYRELERGDRDRITALLADLLTRLEIADAPAPVRHELRLAVLLDQLVRGNYAARDLGMAETALTQAHGKLVIGAANSHIQRIAMPIPGFTVPTLGTHVANARGDGYVSVAVTAATGTTFTRRPDPTAPGGVAVLTVPLPPPREDSIEAMIKPGHLLDLRPLHGKLTGPRCLRVLDTFQDIDVPAAFDVVVCLERLDADG
ncbi:erythromycin esterase family protein [Actinoplanes sp. N902-109]|uniref:erythromycin esterase family protein n=1 Tax=Actinoplanes sp. (strain N902-109) TaxID=649831 RepID=UPI000329639A|nr:erythromycin esterase family protein [Actinoplanes sp. N902-109]AGL15456.1 erythromycin esterase [Actinoplanes sp. N902-109]